ncbi:MAG: chemotaxis protein CheW [Treponema sp.]|nr:chemotaxis protein CheW [Treponema sp.]
MDTTKSINDVLASQNAALQAQSVAAVDENGKEKIAVFDYRMVTFSLAGKDYAIDIMKVKEIFKAGSFTYVPNTLPFVLGVYNLRGEIIPIVDLRIFFNIDVGERQSNKLEKMLIVSVGEQVFGVVVDDIDKIVGIQKSAIQPPHPLFGDINIKFIQGVVESNNRLYILLDIDRIFNAKIDPKEREASTKDMLSRTSVKVQSRTDSFAAPVSAQAAPAPEAAPKAPANEPAIDENFGFVTSSLATLRKFEVTGINEKWVKERYVEWAKERGKDKVQFQSVTDADEYLKPFYSQCNGSWWKKDYADAIYKALPDNTAKQIVVWNPGCGKGFESYSLACLLRKRYPEAKIRIYAHDIDLLSVSNAPLLSVPADVANDWYAPYITKKANGDYTFINDVRNSVMFEYHDCMNTNALPNLDIVFTRDLISFMPKQAQETLIADFTEKLKGNGIVILGQNETLENNGKWTGKSVGSVTVFGKK